MAAIQGAVYALCFETEWSQWKLGSGIRLLTALYTCNWSSANCLWSVHNAVGEEQRNENSNSNGIIRQHRRRIWSD
ncbi:hypothetical protein JHK82_012733 [Glycine max]|nr:hypothetical protein JHK82_012733 [Glycine max]